MIATNTENGSRSTRGFDQVKGINPSKGLMYTSSAFLFHVMIMRDTKQCSRSICGFDQVKYINSLKRLIHTSDMGLVQTQGYLELACQQLDVSEGV